MTRQNRGITQDVIAAQNATVLAVAHRGVWDSAPENSLAALREAIRLGVDIVEIDAQLTADSHVVVIHDDTLDRTSDMRGCIGKMTLAEIRQARLRRSDGGSAWPLSNEKVPLLYEVLEEARGRIVINVDVKHEQEFGVIARDIRDKGLSTGVIMKSPVDLASARFPLASPSLDTQVPYMPMIHLKRGKTADILRQIDDIGVAMVEANFDHIDAVTEAYAEFQRLGVRIWVNTLDCSHSLDYSDTRALAEPDAVWGALIRAGVGAIQVDHAAEFIEFRSTLSR
ncbi:glycerophosphodiester phosphodiesterase family protein [Pectobacterium carotovorum]|uniref:glycerophosphodiester phosphodiesterase family protein n=1 Tax=Pectobacterium carotovorum TaxID=554 RepID=UPI00057F44E5|nr:glycerophosphodiester phosphodiesterase family protein [Pectobacterium carotovorum]KHT37254.1 glycerophosphodiester phosphodiesterase [Pectobacterium carotovorum subsp. carotovorum]MBA0178973.1 glycerophosphodiester phosphodiesterase family protein [Pectobacterium carotovorum]UFT96306.1 glycerophosphodiester phosphodiesterase family protein [Pectobacterium carotovorum]